jgi:phenylalanine-4-hydroxylase
MSVQNFAFSPVPMPLPPFSIEVKYKAKPSYPIAPSASPEGAIGDEILPPHYADEQNQTWQKLYEKQHELIYEHPYLCNEYKQGLSVLNFPQKRIPYLNETSAKLSQATGWKLMRVSGLVPPEKFFRLLANKIFPCTDFIRHQDELDYTPAPDLFHDQVGHLPMITHPQFAEFFRLFGLAGSRTKTQEQMDWFDRIYWFTTEFGLIRSVSGKTQIYGAGIASSCGEILNSLSAQVERRPFDLEEICETKFDIFHMQTLYFELESFEQLQKEFVAWAQKRSFLS